MDDYDQYITEMANETENYGVARNALWNAGPKAVDAISCQHCHPAPEEIDVPSLLIEKLENDSSISVRRAAIRALAGYSSDSRPAGAARKLLAENEADPDLVGWAENIMRRTKYMTPSRMAPLAPETISPSDDHRRQEPT